MWALYIVVILWKIKRCGDEIRDIVGLFFYDKLGGCWWWQGDIDSYKHSLNPSINALYVDMG